MTVYEIYDGRYITEPDRAICFEVCDTLEEALKNRKEYGNLNVIVEAKLKKVKIIFGLYQEIMNLK